MPSRIVRIAATTVAGLALLTACSSGGGAAQPSTPESPSSAPSNASGPKVPAPLPTDALMNDPCSVLTADGATQVGLALPGTKDTNDLAGCSWRSSGNSVNSVGITVVPQNTSGISDIYAQKDAQAYFTPVSIDGYPGVFSAKTDLRPSGNCQLWVGVTDQLAVAATALISVGPNKNDPCSIAQKFANAMITQLKAQA
ncbi:DUF3558 domain-containing protein [Amycolatopsis sp. CA-161197]|uniref:DUF3558 domain-containing protein n=1 Tax=Amycolatopsis sp. CA-161197 TaxID=3239922 RepID=UPI003D9214EB